MNHKLEACGVHSMMQRGSQKFWTPLSHSQQSYHTFFWPQIALTCTRKYPAQTTSQKQSPRLLVRQVTPIYSKINFNYVWSTT